MTLKGQIEVTGYKMTCILVMVLPRPMVTIEHEQESGYWLSISVVHFELE